MKVDHEEIQVVFITAYVRMITGKEVVLEQMNPTIVTIVGGVPEDLAHLVEGGPEGSPEGVTFTRL